MTQDEAIKRILLAIAELASQAPIGRTSANDAITKLEEVIEAIQKRQHQISQNPILQGFRSTEPIPNSRRSK